MTKSNVMALAPMELSMQNQVCKPKLDGTMLAGFLILALFFGVGGLWAGLAPLSSAVVADGLVMVEGNRKTVQHLEGGIIRDLMVGNGDSVTAGTVLVRLEDAQSRSTWELLRAKYFALKGLEARLTAERDRAEQIFFPKTLLDHRNIPEVQEVMLSQETIFAARNRRYLGEADILNKRIALLEAEIGSYSAQVKAATNQIGLLYEEIRPLKPLVAKKISPRPTLLKLQRQAAHFEGVRGQQKGLIAKSEQSIAETSLRITDLQNKRMDEVLTDLRDAQDDLSEVQERLSAAGDVLKRRDVVSPINGTVVNLQFFTPGGVVGPGKAIMDIVPHNEELIIESQIKPVDIDSIGVGLPAEVRFTAFSQRTTPTLTGEVIYVSADVLTNLEAEEPESYFVARVKVSAEELARLGGREISPGMPAQTMILSEERTMLDYLFDPIRQSMRLAFREH